MVDDKKIEQKNLEEKLSEIIKVTKQIKNTYKNNLFDYTSKGEPSAKDKCYSKYEKKFKEENISKDDLELFDLGESTLGISPLVEEYLSNLNQNKIKEFISHYPSTNADKNENIGSNLIETITKKYNLKKYSYTGLDGKITTKYPISIGTGSNELLERISRIFVEPEEIIQIHEPTFFRFKEAASHANAHVKSSDLRKENDFEWGEENLEEYLTAIEDKQTRLLWLCTPNNPFGTTIPIKDIEEITKKASEYKKIVVVDEAYQDFINEKDETNKNNSSSINLINKYDNLIVTRTLSKGHGLANIRVGYAISSPELTEVLEKTRLQYPLNTMSQYIATMALKDEKHIENIIEKTTRNRNEVVSKIKDYVKVYDSKTNIIVLQGKNIFENLSREKIITQQLDYISLLEGQDYVRVTIKDEKSNSKLINAIKKIYGK